MTAEAAELLEKALLLPGEDREELVGAILEHTEPLGQELAQLLELVERRMENVRTGKSKLTPADETHRQMRAMLAAGR